MSVDRAPAEHLWLNTARIMVINPTAHVDI